MTTRQLTVSAIRQHFESASYLETADTSKPRTNHVTRPTHVMPSKSESESVTQKKEPPKTRPKPKNSVVVASKSGDISRSLRPIVNVVAQDEFEPNHSDECTCTDDVVFLSLGREPNSSHTFEDTDRASSRQPSTNNLPVDDPMQTSRVSAKRISRDEMDIVRRPVKQTVVNRWASTSSLLSDAAAPYTSTDDVKEAINRAKQKPVLQRIVGMKLEGERLPQNIDETASNHCEDTSPAWMNELTCETQTDLHLLPDMSAAGHTKPFTVSTCDALTSTNRGSASADALSELNPLSDVVENVMTECRPKGAVLKMLSTHEMTIENEEDSGTSTIGGINRQVCRPISLYPEDMASPDTHTPLTVIGTGPHSPVSANNSTPETLQSDRQDRLPRVGSVQKQTSLIENTVTERTQVAASRKSYRVLSEFIGDNFSFLDDFDDTTETHRTPADIDCSAADIEQRVAALSSRPTSSIDSSVISAGTAERRTYDSCDEREQSTEITPRNQRPKYTSIVLPNGEILEIICNAFTFLDDYDKQTVDDCTC